MLTSSASGTGISFLLLLLLRNRNFLLRRVVEAAELHQLTLVDFGGHPFRLFRFLKASGESPGSSGAILHPVVATRPPVAVVAAAAATPIVAFFDASSNVIAKVDSTSLRVAVGVASAIVVISVATSSSVGAESVAAVSVVSPSLKTSRVPVDQRD